MRSITLFLFIYLMMSACNNADVQEMTLPLPPHYIIPLATGDLVIDGKADEASWKNAKWTNDFIDIEGPGHPSPFYKTNVKMLWDKDFLYFYAELLEEHIWGDITERDAVIFYNNDFEIFIHPSPTEPQYAEFEVNALGTFWELILLQPYRIGGPVSNYWDLNDTRIGISIEGTLNDPSDIDSMWTVEMAIPLKPLAELNRGSGVKDGTQWRINFSRVQWQHDINNEIYSRKKDPDTGEYLPEYNWVWSPQFAIDMHRPEHWGYVQFSEEAPGSAVDFTEPEWQTERQLLFYLHREHLAFKRESGEYASQIEELGGPLFMVDKREISVSYNKTISGYEFSITDPAKGRITLNQDEYLSITEDI